MGACSKGGGGKEGKGSSSSNSGNGNSGNGNSSNGGSLDCGKYARYTQEQVEILERVYSDCPKPSSSRRQQLIKECPILANIGHKQLKVWFQNRRYSLSLSLSLREL